MSALLVGLWLRILLAAAIASTDATPHERRTLYRIAEVESQFDWDVARCRRFGRDGDATAWQIIARDRAELRRLCTNFGSDARVALERVRESESACRHLPGPDRLAVYARGSCRSEEGRVLSRVRWVE